MNPTSLPATTPTTGDPVAPANPLRLYTVRETAEILGCSEQAAYRRIYEDGLPVIRIGKRGIRVRHSDLKAWLDDLAQDERIAA